MLLPDPNDAAAYDEELPKHWGVKPRRCRAGSSSATTTRRGPACTSVRRQRSRAVLGDRVVRLEHAGSTSVPGLPAKPMIDVVLEVADSSNEPAYVVVGDFPVARARK
jgi:hypothetical protein